MSIVKEMLTLLRGNPNRSNFSDAVENAEDVLEVQALEDENVLDYLRETQGKFRRLKQNFINRDPHHMTVREAAVAVPGQPARRP